MLVQAPSPVPQRLHIVRPEGLDVLGHEAGPLESQEHAGDRKRVRVGEDVALGERSRLSVGVIEPGDAMVEEPPAGLEEARQAVGIQIDPLVTDVLDHADAGDRVEPLAGEVAVVEHADGYPLLQTGLAYACPSERGLRL